ncbi:MAG: hypothetical protein ACI90V_007943 [Bacillariaceae sp.]|jgi:hypothetical protein
MVCTTTTLMTGRREECLLYLFIIKYNSDRCFRSNNKNVSKDNLHTPAARVVFQTNKK